MQITFKIKRGGDWIEDVRGALSFWNSFWNPNGVRGEKVEQPVKEKNKSLGVWHWVVSRE